MPPLADLFFTAIADGQGLRVERDRLYLCKEAAQVCWKAW
jgi:hypothetical protein